MQPLGSLTERKWLSTMICSVDEWRACEEERKERERERERYTCKIHDDSIYAVKAA